MERAKSICDITYEKIRSEVSACGNEGINEIWNSFITCISADSLRLCSTIILTFGSWLNFHHCWTIPCPVSCSILVCFGEWLPFPTPRTHFLITDFGSRVYLLRSILQPSSRGLNWKMDFCAFPLLVWLCQLQIFNHIFSPVLVTPENSRIVKHTQVLLNMYRTAV